jgi:hypothetical protein
MKLIKLIDENKQKLADGCILPDGQVAIAWCDLLTHGTYPDIESLVAIQSKIPGREIVDHVTDLNQKWSGIDFYGFSLVRDEDVTGVSGKGVVAVGCKFPRRMVVLQWVVGIPSTFWYPNLETLRVLHGHNGKTRIVPCLKSGVSAPSPTHGGFDE